MTLKDVLERKKRGGEIAWGLVTAPQFSNQEMDAVLDLLRECEPQLKHLDHSFVPMDHCLKCRLAALREGK